MRAKAPQNPPNNLKAWRTHRGLSQSDLAEAVGISASQLCLIETGARRLCHGRLLQFARVLDVTPGAILDFTPGEFEDDLMRAARNLPLERQSDAKALLIWLGRSSVHLTTFEPFAAQEQPA